MRADALFVADVLDVGGPENEAPTITPSPAPPTNTPTATATPGASRTARANSGATVIAPSETPEQRPQRSLGVDLQGRRATLALVRQYAGDSPSRLVIDAQYRRLTEEFIRAAEGTGRTPPCGIGGPPPYIPGAQYLVLTQTVEHPVSATDIRTWFRWRIDGDDVILGDASFPESERSYLSVNPANYARYFPGVEGQIGEDGTEGGTLVFIQSPRVPLASLVTAILGVRAGPSRITPPETGSAGLAAR